MTNKRINLNTDFLDEGEEIIKNQEEDTKKEFGNFTSDELADIFSWFSWWKNQRNNRWRQ